MAVFFSIQLFILSRRFARQYELTTVGIAQVKGLNEVTAENTPERHTLCIFSAHANLCLTAPLKPHTSRSRVGL